MTQATRIFATMLACGACLGTSTAFADPGESTRQLPALDNMRFEQLARNAPYQGRRTEIIVSGKNGRYDQLESSMLYTWLTYREAGPVPGLPGLGDTTFHINQTYPATVTTSTPFAEPIGLRFAYQPPRLMREQRRLGDPVVMCNEELSKDRSVSSRGKDIRLRSAYMTRITIRRVMMGTALRGFIPQRVNVVTGTPLDAVVVCKPLAGATGGTTQQRTAIGSTTQGTVVKAPARAQSNSGSTRKTPSGRPIKEMFRPIVLSGNPTSFAPDGAQSCPSRLALEAIVETSGLFDGMYRFSGPGRRLGETALRLRAPYRIVLKDEYPLQWTTLPPDADGIKRQTLRAKINIVDTDRRGVTMQWKDIVVACTK